MWRKTQSRARVDCDNHYGVPFILPDPIRKKRLRDIQKNLSECKEEGSIKALGTAVQLILKDAAFQKQIAASPQLRTPVKGEADLMKLAWAFVYQLLYAKDFVAAAIVLWDEENFCAEAHFVKLMWEALMTKRMICIIGGGGCGKTYCPSVYFLLEWIADPSWTRLQLASASEDHMRKNLFADVTRLHSAASLELPGKPDSESIALDKKRGMGVFTLTLPGGPESKSKIKGAHTKPRPMHPVFGRRSRVFCLIDEAQETPENIFSEIPNRFSTVVGSNVDHLKFAICANPKNLFSQFGNCAKPINGWDSISDSDETWESQEGWTVISLDATRHENVVQRKVVYPGFVTWDGVQVWLRKCHGNADDPMFWTYVKGKFPPLGLANTVIKQNWLTASEGEWCFDDHTVSKAGGDPAYVGDRPTLACGRVGRAIAWIDFAGNRHVLDTPRMAIQVDVLTVVERGDSQDLADRYMEALKPLGVQPDGFGIDMTGAGRGTHDIIRRQWAQKVGPISGDESGLAPIHGIEYGSSPSEIKIAEEDTSTPREQFNIMASELWFAAAKLFEYDVVRVGKGVDLKVFSELAARQGGMQVGLGRKLTVESKGDYKKRTGMDSPDLADACLIMISVARWTTPNLIPRAKDTTIEKPERPAPAWEGFGQQFGVASMDGMSGAEEMQDLIVD